MKRWSNWLVVFFALVMLLVTSVEVSHFHNDAAHVAPKPLSKKSSDSCLICNALHAPALSASANILHTHTFYTAEAIPSVLHDVPRLEAFGLFVRPPPIAA